MNTTFLSYLTAGLVAAGLAVGVNQVGRARTDDVAPEPLSTHVGPGQLRYPAGATQLAYLAIKPVLGAVPPLTEPLPARLTYDEDRTVRVFSPVAGRAVQILAQAGQRVRAGQVLAWLLAPDYDTAVADWRKAQADLDAKQPALARARALHDMGVIATRELESSQADARAAQAEVARASARLKALGQLSADGRFALRASVDGVVVERHLNPGQELRPDAAEPVFVITDPSHLDVVADVADSELAVLHVGQMVRLESEGRDGQAVTGRISAVGAAMDANTRRVPVRAHLMQVLPDMRPEMFVRMAPLDAKGIAMAQVPNSALVTSGVNDFVFVEQSPGFLVKTAVQLAHRGRELSYVSSGLSAGQRVVTTGAILLDSEMTTDH